MSSESDPRKEYRERLARHRARDSIQLDVEWTEHAPLESLRVRLFLAENPREQIAAELDDIFISWHRLGVLGGFEGMVHDVRLLGIVKDADQLYFEAMVDVGSAPRSALDVLLRAIRGLKVEGLPVDRVVFGWTAAEWAEDEYWTDDDVEPR
jgi:hypothetical protein